MTFLIATLLVPTSHASPADYVVVLNARNPTAKVDRDELKKIYLGQTAFWHGVVPMTVVTWSPSSEIGTGFLTDVVGSSAQKYDRTWSSKQLSGQGIAPAIVSSVDDVVKAVAARPGGIGYLLASEAWDLPDTVKTVPVSE